MLYSRQQFLNCKMGFCSMGTRDFKQINEQHMLACTELLAYISSCKRWLLSAREFHFYCRVPEKKKQKIQKNDSYSLWFAKQIITVISRNWGIPTILHKKLSLIIMSTLQLTVTQGLLKDTALKKCRSQDFLFLTHAREQYVGAYWPLLL